MSNCGYNNSDDNNFRNNDLTGCSSYGKTCSRDVKTDEGYSKQLPTAYGWRYDAPQSCNSHSVRENTIPSTNELVDKTIYQPKKSAYGYPSTGLQKGDLSRYNPATDYRITHTDLCIYNASHRPGHVCNCDLPTSTTNQRAPGYQESCGVFVTMIIILAFIVLITVCIKMAKSIRKT